MIETKKSFCRFCHLSCGIEVDVDVAQRRVLAVRGDRENPLSKGYTCVKGRAVPEEFHHPDRLLSSKKRTHDGWSDISCNQALDEIAKKLLDIRERYGPRSISLYTGSGSSYGTGGSRLTSAWLQALGSPSMYTALTVDCPCYVVAAHRFFGTAAVPFPIYGGVFDLEHADVAMFIGTNPVASHGTALYGPLPARRLSDARKRGMRLIVVDPRRIDMARRADLHLQVKPGEDAPLLAGIIKVIIERALYDREYVRQHVSGLDELHAAVADFDLEYVARRTLVPADLVEKAAVMFATAKTGAARQGAGITMARHQNLNTHLVYAINALCGRIDRAGGLVYNPGVFARPLPEPPQPFPLPLFSDTAARVRGLRALFLVPRWAELPSPSLPDEILEPGPGRVRALIVHGGNPVATFPDQDKTARAMKALDLLVVIDPFVTATARFAHYMLAPRHFLERPDVNLGMETSLPVPFGQYTPSLLDGPGDLLHDWEVGWELAQRMGLTLRTRGIHMDRKPTADEVLKGILGRTRVPLDEVKKYPSGHVFGDIIVGGILPHAIAHPDKKMAAGHPAVVAELREVRSEPVVDSGGYKATEAFSHRMICMRMPEIHNSKNWNIPSLRRQVGSNRAYMNPGDLERLGIKDQDVVIIDSGYGRIKAVVGASPDVMTGVIAMAHSWGIASEHEGDTDIRELGSPTGRLIPSDQLYDPVTGMALQSALPVNVHGA
jgi:anaerobic selenocysteine-containing dehydrogenase